MEMEKHDDGWPFLQPVNCKQFTSYRKFIKNPMDFSTMKQKLRDERYRKFPKCSVTPKKFVVITLKFELRGSTIE